MAQPSRTDDVLKRAQSSRERARAAVNRSATLLHETARLNNTVHRTESALKELEETVEIGKNASRRMKQQTKKRPGRALPTPSGR